MKITVRKIKIIPETGHYWSFVDISEDTDKYPTYGTIQTAIEIRPNMTVEEITNITIQKLTSFLTAVIKSKTHS